MLLFAVRAKHELHEMIFNCGVRFTVATFKIQIFDYGEGENHIRMENTNWFSVCIIIMAIQMKANESLAKISNIKMDIF